MYILNDMIIDRYTYLNIIYILLLVVTAGKCLQNRPFVRFFCICELTNLPIEFFGEILSTC